MSVEDLRVSAATEETAADHIRSDITEEMALSPNDGREAGAAVELAQAAPTGDRLPAAPATVQSSVTPPVTQITPDTANIVRLAATVSIDDIRIDGANLVLVQADGTEIVIINGATRVPTILLGDVELPQQTFIAALEGNGINVAAGPDGSYSASSAPGSSGGNFEDSISASQDGPVPLADLLDDTALDDGTAFGTQDTGKDVPVALAAAFAPAVSEAADANGLFEQSTFSGQLTFISGSQQGRVVDVALTTALTSGGVAVVTAMTAGGTVANPTVILTGTANGQTVFVLEVTNTLTGQFTFTLMKSLDHAGAGSTGANDLLDLDFTYTVADNTPDSSSSTFSIQIADDGPATAAVVQSVVQDEALVGGNIDGPVTATLTNVQLGIDWGADSANNDTANDRSLAFTSANVAVAGAYGAALTSFGVAVSTIVLADGTLVGYTGAAPSSINAGNVVFHAALSDAGNGTYSFTLVKPLDHQAGAGQAPLTLTFGYTATDSDGDSAANTFTVSIVDDAPVANVGTGSTAEEESLSGGNNDVTDGLLATSNGALNIDWGSDNANLGGSNDRSVAFTNANVTVTGAYGSALTSLGVAVSTIVLADGTLVGYTGAAPSSIEAGNVVFHAALSDAARGSYSFTLVKPLDHATGNGENTLTLTFGYTATDSDGDSAANTFTISIVDDAPVANVGTGSTAEEESLGGGNNDVTDGLLATANASLNIDWGSDNANLGGSNDRSVAFTNANVTVTGAYGSALTSLGVAVSTILLADGTLVGYTGAAPSSIDAGNVVFHAVLSDTARGSYSFTLVKPLDHQAGNGENTLTLTFGYTATDSDGDSAANTFTVSIVDDAPVANVGTEATVEDEAVRGNNNETETVNLSGTSGGSLNIDWGSDNANLGGSIDRSVAFTGASVTVVGAYGASLTSFGRDVRTTVLADGTLVGYTGDGQAPGSVTDGRIVFYATLSDAARGSYSFTLVQPLDHAAGNGTTAEASLSLTFGYTATDSDGDSVSNQFTVRVADDRPLIEAPEATALDEEIVRALDGNIGDSYAQAENPQAAAKSDAPAGYVTGSLGVSWGADDNNSGSVQRSLSFIGYDAVSAGEEGATTYAPVMNGLTQLESAGDAVFFFSTVINDVPVLVGFTGDNPSIQENWVFTVALDDTADKGAYTFTLLKAIDHARAGVEDDLSLSFDFRAKDSDGDIADGRFTVTINDDAPVTNQADDSKAEDEAVNRGNQETESEPDLSAIATGGLNISWGSDSAAGRVSVAFIENAGVAFTGTADAEKLTSLGLAVETVLIGDVLVGYTGAAPQTLSADNVVFRVSLSAGGNGAYRFELIKPLDHADGESPTGEATLSLTFRYTATDADGDPADGTFTVEVADDTAEIRSDRIENGTVEEEQLVGGNEDSDGRGDRDTANNDNRTTHVADGSLGIRWGADRANNGTGLPGDRSVQFTDAGIEALENRALTSNGKPLEYTIVTVDGQPVLLAYVGTLPETMPTTPEQLKSAGLVFSVSLSDLGSGSYTFQLHGALDHKPQMQDGELVAVQGEDRMVLRFEFTATDSDGDVTDAARFAVRVIDDVPVAGNVGDRYVEEEALDDGNEDISPVGVELAGVIANGGLITARTGTSLNMSWGSDDGNLHVNKGFTGEQVAGDRSIIFAFDPKRPVPLRSSAVEDTGLTLDDVAQFMTVRSGSTDIPLAKLTSGGQSLTYTLTGNGTLLTASVGSDVIFTVRLFDEGKGSYDFQLMGVLDHQVENPGASNEDVLTFDFLYTARDGDGDKVTGTFAVNVIDDSPAHTWWPTTNLTLDEDDLRPNGNDTRPESLSISGNLNVAFGADGGTYMLESDDAIWSRGDGTLTAGTLTAGDGSWQITVASDGRYTFTLLHNTDHGPADNGANTLNIGVRFIATDGDGDNISGNFNIRIVDDVPVATSATINASVNEAGLSDAATDLPTVVGNLSGLVKGGADGIDKYTVETDKLSSSLTSLTSNGVPISYTVVGDTLYATAGTIPVFTFKVDPATGAYTFEQQGPLDHNKTYTINNRSIDAVSINDAGESVAVNRVSGARLAYVGRTDDGDVIIRVTNAGQSTVDWKLYNTNGGSEYDLSIAKNTSVYINVGKVANGMEFDLRDVAGIRAVAIEDRPPFASVGGTTLTLDLSTAVTVSDGDGDTLALSGKFNITVTDTAPSVAPVNATVFEDGDRTKTDGDRTKTVSLGITWQSDSGSQKTLTVGGLVGARTHSGEQVLTLTSNGNDITVVMKGGVLVGYVGNTEPGTLSDSSIVFTVAVDVATGEYTFTLRQPLDHVSPKDGKQYLDLTFQAIATDADGDRATGNFTVTVDAAGELGSIDYSKLISGIIVNLSASQVELDSQVVAGRTATDLATVTDKVVGIDGMDGVTDAKGGAGNDILIGGNEANTLDGGAGNDKIYGGGGADVLRGGAGDDYLEGGLGADLLEGGDGDDRFILGGDVTGSGKRVIMLGDGTPLEVSIDGLAGTADRVTGGDGNDTIELQRGNKAGFVADYRSAPGYISGVEKIVGTDGNDVILLAANPVADDRITIEGGAGKDVIGGSNKADALYGQDGDDLISGLGGDDFISGGSGNDVIWGGAGIDTVEGGSGNDTINLEVDQVYAPGTTRTVTLADGKVITVDIAGKAGTSDSVDGGTDNDTIVIRSGSQGFVLDGNQTALKAVEKIVGSNGDDLIVMKSDYSSDAAAGRTTIEGGAGNDIIVGGGANDVLDGGADDDLLAGGNGADILIGGSGDDQLWGGKASDNLFGNGTSNTGSDLNVTAGEADSANYAGTFAKYRVVFNPAFGQSLSSPGIGIWQVEALAGAPEYMANATTDNLYGIELIKFADGFELDLRMAVRVFDGTNLVGTYTSIQAANDAASTLAGFRIELAGTIVNENAEITKEGLTVVGGVDDTGITLTLKDVSNITLAGAAPINVIGNGANNAVEGNDGANIITSGKGSDALIGGKGDDTFIVNADIDDAIGEGSRNVTLGDGTTRAVAVGHRSGEGDSLNGGDGKDEVRFVAAGDDLGFIFDRANYGGGLANVERFIGTGNDDMILLPGTYNAGTDRLFIDGGAGNDVLQGSNTQGDEILGGTGNDLISGLGGDDILRGDDGDDEIWGGDGNDLLEGGSGNDTLNGGAGSDQLDGGAGIDTADFSGDREGIYVRLDQKWATALANKTGRNWTQIVAGIGDGSIAHDKLISIENITGSAHDDLIAGDGGANVIKGGRGNDYITGLGGNDTIEGGAGNDELFGDAGSDTLDGGEGNDILEGGDGNDRLTGGAGNDRLSGGAGDDMFKYTIGDGVDVIDGGVGGDMLQVTGSDNLERTVLGATATGFTLDVDGDGIVDITATGVENLMLGQAGGDDTLTVKGLGTAETITLSGNANLYTVLGTNLPATYVISGSALTVESGGGDDRIDASELNKRDVRDNEVPQLALTIESGSGNDTVYGSAGADVIRGGAGVDTLYGNAGNDRIAGNDGDDIIYGGAGDDMIWGDAGNDTIIWNVGDGHDIVSGSNTSARDAGTDTFVANGSDAADTFLIESRAAYLARAAGNPLNVDSQIVVSHGADIASELRFIDEIVINAGEGDDVIDLTGLSGPAGVRVAGEGGTDTVRLSGLWTDYVFTEDAGVYSASRNGVVVLRAADVQLFEFTGTGTTTVYTMDVSKLINVAPVAVDNTGSVVEAGGVGNLTPGTAIASGSLIGDDLDGNTATNGESVDTRILATVGGQNFSAVSEISIVGTYGTLIVQANGDYRYELNDTDADTQALAQGIVGKDEFSYTIRDFHGLTSTASLTIDVTGQNDAAVLSSATVSLTEGDTAAAISTGGTLTISDVDSDAKFLVQTNVAGQYGKFSINADGAWTYLATSAHNEFEAGRPYSETFVVHSVDGTETAVVINIAGTNDAPTTSNVSASGNEDNVITVQLSGSDVDGTVAGYVINTLPLNGKLYRDMAASQEISQGATVSGPVYFKPNENHYGAVSFTYAAKDDKDGIDATPATASITVNAVNDAPSDIVFAGNIGLTASTELFGVYYEIASGRLFTAGAVDVDNTSGFTYSINGNSSVNLGQVGLFNEALAVNAASGNFTTNGMQYTGSQTFTVNNVLVKDASGLPMSETVTISLGTNDDNVLLRTGNSHDQVLYGFGGDDTISAGSGNDWIAGGRGADVLNGGIGKDVFAFATGDSSAAVATRWEWTGFLQGAFFVTGVSGYDVINDFDRNQDKLTFQIATRRAADVAKFNGDDSDADLSARNVAIRSHSISNGVVSFDDSGDYSATPRFLINTAERLGMAVQYLQRNDLGAAGTTVAFHAILNGIDYTFVYQQGGNAEGSQHSLIALKGVILSDFNSLISNAIDPIVLDLDHNGFAFSSLDNGVSFDIDADGHKDQIAWTSADGILAYDLDGNGRIDNGSEIFTPSFNGGGHASGIAALATLDSNGDGKIDAEDDAFSKLSIWVDANHNGISDDGELSGLLDHSITSISLDTSSTGATEDGQAVLSEGHFTMADGSTGDFLEVGFDTLLGGQPDHVALGGDGDDILTGGAGFSQFTGGAGADTFVFDPAALQSLDIVDVVTDYKVGEGDMLDVSGLLDSMLGHQASAEEAAASIRTTVTGADTTVSVQVDDSWKDVAVLQNHTEAVKILFDDKHTIDVSHH